MDQDNKRLALEDFKVPVKLKLSALWVSVVLCYIYGDYFGLYKPGALQAILDGKMGPLGPTSQGILLGTSVMMAIPSLMVFLSLAMPPAASRVANVFFGFLYSVIMLVTLPGSWIFYKFLAAIGIALTGLVVWHAWNWPAATPEDSRRLQTRTPEQP
jgi:hypothetical protein